MPPSRTNSHRLLFRRQEDPGPSQPTPPGNRNATQIPSMQDVFMEHLRAHGSKKATRLDLTRNMTFADMKADLQMFLGYALEESTWKGYAGVWLNLEVFCAQVKMPVCEFAAALYLRRLMLTPSTRKGKFLLVSTIYGYTKSLQAITGRMDAALWRQGFLRTIARVLVKMGAKIPTHQAQPMMRHQVYGFVDRVGAPEEYRMLVYLSWKLAARADDLLKCWTDDCELVLYQERQYIVVRWRPSERRGKGCGRQKNAGNGLGHSCVLACGDYLPRVLAYLKTRKGKSLSPYTTPQVTAYLKKYIDPKLTAHSPKRGALTDLLLNECSLRIIVEMARHGLETALPMATRTYLPAIPLALAIGTQHATVML